MKPTFDTHQYVARVDELLAKLVESPDRNVAEACFLGTLGIAEALYGRNSTQVKAIHDARKLGSSSQYAVGYHSILLGESLRGILTNHSSAPSFRATRRPLAISTPPMRK